MLLGLIAFVPVQKRYGFYQLKPLYGYFQSTAKPAFSRTAWMTGAYQDQYHLNLEDSVGFKPFFVRLYNQVDYSLFNIAHASKILAGKNEYLFADIYISGYTGTDFAGKGVMDHKISEIKFLQDYLWKEKGILLMVVFAPGKGFYYPEYIPDRFMKKRRDVTNYSYYVERCKAEGINHIDFNRFLLDKKDTAKYVLYPKTGIHWSSYAAWLCGDSLQRYIGTKLNRQIPRMVLDSLTISAEARDYDNDQGQTMNLVWDIPYPPLAYPKFHFTYDSVQPKPAGLIIGDSFYWYWYYNGIIDNTFKNKEFWYYNNEIYPEQFTAPKNVGQINFIDGIMKQNVIILLQTNGGYGELGYGWVDLAYDYLYPGFSRAKEIERQMQASQPWMKQLEAKAKERNITTEHMMRLDAIFMMNNEIKKRQKHN